MVNELYWSIDTKSLQFATDDITSFNSMVFYLFRQLNWTTPTFHSKYLYVYTYIGTIRHMFGDERLNAEEDKFAFRVTSGTGLRGFRDIENGDAREHVQSSILPASVNFVTIGSLSTQLILSQSVVGFLI